MYIHGSVGKFLQETASKQPWRGGIYNRGVLHLQPVKALTARDLFERTISYELATAVLEQAGGKGCPLWLREAYAVYHCGEIANLTAPYGVTLTSFSDLDQDIQQYRVPPQRNDVHFILGHTMKFLIESFGEAKAWGVFKQFNGMATLDDVFKKSFNQDFSTIEKSWSAYIGSQTGRLPK